MGIFGFGKSSRSEGDHPPRVPPLPATASAGMDSREDSFLTGDERVDAKNLRLLLDTIAAVNSTIDLDLLLVSIVDKAIAVTRAERGFLLLRDPVTGELAIRVARDNLGRDLPRETRFSTKVVSQVEASSKPVHSMVNNDAQALELSQSVFDLKIRAVMCVPLAAKGIKLLGEIYVDSKVANREFTKSDLKFFAAFGAQATVALENARLLRDSLEKERMAGELRIAQSIQKKMLPGAAPNSPPLDIAGAYEPASEATGDSYDFVTLDGGRVAFVITDVSGHGIGPALVTMSSRARLRAYLGLGLPIGEAVTRLNRDFQSETEVGIFQTMFAGVVDPGNGNLQFVNAGHPPALLLRSGGGIVALEKSGVAVGFLENEIYKPSETLQLAPGDVLVAYTDGITEARRAGGDELFGEARLKEVVMSNASRSASAILNSIIQAVKEFSGGRPADDLTLITIRRTP